jgi:hypothetical protein
VLAFSFYDAYRASAPVPHRCKVWGRAGAEHHQAHPRAGGRDLNLAVLRPGSALSGKARKAVQLQDGGQDIEPMTEDNFHRALDLGR